MLVCAAVSLFRSVRAESGKMHGEWSETFSLWSLAGPPARTAGVWAGEHVASPCCPSILASGLRSITVSDCPFVCSRRVTCLSVYVSGPNGLAGHPHCPPLWEPPDRWKCHRDLVTPGHAWPVFPVAQGPRHQGVDVNTTAPGGGEGWTHAVV